MLQRQNLESRAESARWTRTLTFDPLPNRRGEERRDGFCKAFSDKERLRIFGVLAFVIVGLLEISHHENWFGGD